MIDSLYNEADCCLLVYDITNRKSFEDCLLYFKDKIKSLFKKNIKVALCGNKIDYAEERKVSYLEGAEFALKNKS